MLTPAALKRLPRSFGPVSLLAYAALCLFLALPGGSQLADRNVWKNKHNQEQFDRWAAFVSKLGVDVSSTDLHDSLWLYTKSYLELRNQLLKSIRWVPEQLGFSQSWRMFSNPQTHPSRLWLELDEGNGFRPLYVTGSSQYTWQSELLQHHRLRKLTGRISRGNRKALYDSLSFWLARRAARDFPRAKSLRVRLYTWKTNSPGSGPGFDVESTSAKRDGKFTRSRSLSLAEYR